MNARSRRSNICSALLVTALAAQFSRPVLAQVFSDDYLTVRANALTCIEQSGPVARRIASCTTIIDLADRGSFTARHQISAIYVARAKAFQQEGDDQAALRDFDTATRKEPSSELAWLGLGNFYMAKSDYSHALESLDHAVQIGPRDSVVYDDRGAAFVGLKRRDEAIADFTRAIALDARDRAALSNRATLYLASGRANLAIADLDTVIRLEPADAKAFYNRGVAYERTQVLDRAVEDYRSATRIQPSFVQAYEALGRVLRKKDPQAALSELSEAVRLDPRSPALKSRAILYLLLGKFEPAIRDLDQAIANDGTDEIAYMDRGVAEEGMGLLEAALADYSHSINIETTSAALVDRGSIYLRLGQQEKALGDFDAALAIDPNDDAALIGRADANYASDERDPDRLAASLADFSRVIAASPKNADAYFVRGDIHFDLKQYAAAYSDFSESLELRPDQPAVLFNRALAAEHLGRSVEAASDREAARKLGASIGGRGAAAKRDATGNPTQIEYAAPQNAPSQEPRVVFAAPLAAPGTNSSTAATAPASTQEVTITGYRRIVVNGRERFCQVETALGSHVEKSTRCYSRQQLEAQQEETREYMQGIRRLGGLVIGPAGSCEHSAVNSCLQ